MTTKRQKREKRLREKNRIKSKERRAKQTVLAGVSVEADCGSGDEVALLECPEIQAILPVESMRQEPNPESGKDDEVYQARIRAMAKHEVEERLNLWRERTGRYLYRIPSRSVG